MLCRYAEPISYEFWLHVRKMVDWVCIHWTDTDEGIWEVRGGQQHFVYSKVMAWVCLTGDHMVLTRSGWRNIRALSVGQQVMSLNVDTQQMEWRPVTRLVSYDVDPEQKAALYRMQGAGMDIIATRDHRMLLARGSADQPQQQGEAVGYETVEELLKLKYSASSTSTSAGFTHCPDRAVLCAGLNPQPAIDIVIPGLERVCQWWWAKDEQRGFLTFLGFWVGNGSVDTEGRVVTCPRKAGSAAWLVALLDDVFPRTWYRTAEKTDGKAAAHQYLIHCPPLHEYLRVMAVGPLGYNPRDADELRVYPHFTKDEKLAAREQQSPYYQPCADSVWSEDAMLGQMRAGPPRCCYVCGEEAASMLVCSSGACGSADRITRAHPDCVGAKLDSAWHCPDCPGQVDASRTVQDSSSCGERHGEENEWFDLKRWLGDVNVADVFSRLDTQQAIALLDGVCRADGASSSTVQYDGKTDKPTGVWYCSTSSFPLVDHLMLIAQLAEARVTLTLLKRGEPSAEVDGSPAAGSVDRWQLALAFTESEASCSALPSAALAEPVDVSGDVDARGYYQYEDDGRVYCIEVEGNSNFLTQRLSWKRLHGDDGGVGVQAQPIYTGNCLDRGIRLAERRSFPADLPRWQQVRNTIYEEIQEKGWNKKRKAYTQYYGSDTLDASVLIMPLVFFMSPTDPRFVSTLDAILASVADDGLVSNNLVFRYNVETTADGLVGEEGTFSICTFWACEAAARLGMFKKEYLEKGRFMFEQVSAQHTDRPRSTAQRSVARIAHLSALAVRCGQMLGYANHLGLYSEEIGKRGEQSAAACTHSPSPRTPSIRSRLSPLLPPCVPVPLALSLSLGNFPQAFTHLALISAAINLDRGLNNQHGQHAAHAHEIDSPKPTARVLGL